MEKYLDGFVSAFLGTLNWTWKSIVFEVPWYTNYFWGLVAISVVVWILEILFPWRKDQAIFRKDFWLDSFYIFFNFFVFAIVVSGFYKLLEILFLDIGISINSLSLFNLSLSYHLIFFIIARFSYSSLNPLALAHGTTPGTSRSCNTL